MYHGRKLTKKRTGGKIRKHSDKKLALAGGHFAATKISDSEKEIREKKRGRGGRKKVVLKYALFANVSIPGKKETKKAKILDVLESPNNRHYARMKIITKGVIIQTDLGKARVTSRAGQHGVVNAVLLE